MGRNRHISLNGNTSSKITSGRSVYSLSEWRFQTTGNHLAALYRSYATDGLSNAEYHGQFSIKVSGTAVALPNQTLPPGNHCDVQVVPVDPDPFCVAP